LFSFPQWPSKCRRRFLPSTTHLSPFGRVFFPRLGFLFSKCLKLTFFFSNLNPPEAISFFFMLLQLLIFRACRRLPPVYSQILVLSLEGHPSFPSLFYLYFFFVVCFPFLFSQYQCAPPRIEIETRNTFPLLDSLPPLFRSSPPDSF